MADYPKFKFNNSGLPYWPPGLSKEFEEYAKRMQATLMPDPDDLPPSLSYNKFRYLISRNRGQQIPMCGSCSFFGKEDAARVRRGDLVLIRGEYKGIVASIKVINGSYLIEFEHRTNGRVNRFLALPEDVKILFRKY